MNDFMFDTVAFNRVLEGSVPLAHLKSGIVIYATHVQEDELNNTPSPGKRAGLLKIFNQFVVRRSPTESLVLGVSRLGEAKLGGGNKIPTETSVGGGSRWGEGKFGADGGLYTQIKSRLDDLKKKDNNIQDALIAETAILNKLCLVTDDTILFAVAKEFGGAAVSFPEFMKEAIG